MTKISAKFYAAYGFSVAVCIAVAGIWAWQQHAMTYMERCQRYAPQRTCDIIVAARSAGNPVIIANTDKFLSDLEHRPQ